MKEMPAGEIIFLRAGFDRIALWHQFPY